MPPGLYFQAYGADPAWSYALVHLSRLAQAAFDFTVRYLRGEIAGGWRGEATPLADPPLFS